MLKMIRPDALVVDDLGLACLTLEVKAVAPPLIPDLSGSLDSLPCSAMSFQLSTPLNIAAIAIKRIALSR